MPVRKPSDLLDRVNPIIMIHGDPASGKTTLPAGLIKPMLYDFDKGYRRSEYNKNFFELLKDPVEGWLEFIDHVSKIQDISCAVFDTGKAMLDDYIAKFVCHQDHRNFKESTGGLEKSGYGDMGAIFSSKILPLREKFPLLFMAHSTDDDGIYRQRIPEITGTSRKMLERACDAIGHLSYEGGVRRIRFTKSDVYLSKGFYVGDVIVPDIEDDEFGTFLQKEVVDVVAKRLNRRYVDAIRADYGLGSTPEEWIAALAKYTESKNMAALQSLVEVARHDGYEYKKETKCFQLIEAK